jgi:protein-tyrosine phosphatase
MRPTLFLIEQPDAGQLSTMAKPRGGEWLSDEMTALRTAGVDILVCALTPTELHDVDLVAEPDEARNAGLEFVPLPIPDRGVPDPRTVLADLQRLAARLRAGAHIVTHCRAGIGRSSLLAAGILVLNGLDPEVVWHRIEQARGLPVPDTQAQRLWLDDLIESVRERP